VKIVVQKFGGTSVAGVEERELVVQKIIAARQRGYAPVVVVSAMGRRGSPYATDTLMELVSGQDIEAREMDLLLACGEIISGVVLAAALRSRGVPTIFLTGAQAGIITDNVHGDAHVLRVEPTRVQEELEKGKVVVVAGFQGISEDGEITTLGRGGSDTTAAALGVVLNAQAVEIYTDVDGIKTADPRLVEEARTLERLTYNEVSQLAHEGARVIHPRAVEILMQKGIPLWIKSTFTDAPGTLVTNGSFLPTDRPVTGITEVHPLTQLTVEASGWDQVRIFKELASEGISIDFITVLPDKVIFNVKEEVETRAAATTARLGYETKVRPKCAKVAAVGAGMTGRPGIMAAVMEALAGEGIEVLQSADSYTTIWCLVKEGEVGRAVAALHRRFYP
jgi:aspartate kinase